MATSQPPDLRGIDPGSSRPARLFQALLAIVAGVAVFLPLVNIAGGFPDNLDAGWQEVLSWGIAHGAQWGKELVFTYGPLGFLAPGHPFNPDTYWVTLSLQIVLAIAMAWLVAENVRRLPLASAGLLAVAAWLFGSSAFMVYPLALLILGRWMRRAHPSGVTGHLLVAGLAAFAAIQPLIKFSAFPMWLVWLALTGCVLWRPRNRLLVLTLVLASGFTVLVAWVACGQRLDNLGAYLDRSWQIAVSYPAAMQLDPALPITDWVALGGALFGLACAGLFAWHARHSPRRVAVYAMLAVTLAVAYRAGATRADGWHLVILWSACAWCAPLLVGLWYEDSGRRSARRAGAVFGLAAIALVLPWLSGAYSGEFLRVIYTGNISATAALRHADLLLQPVAAYHRRQQQWAGDRKAMRLPAIAREVGGGAIDALMHNQSSLLANDLDYRPRPVFQSYSAYSGTLAGLNDAFFRSTRAPPWVMLDWQSIDGHYPTSDDAQALVTLLRDYRPELMERGILLLHRAVGEPTSPDAEAPAREIPVHFKSFAKLPAPDGNAWFARINVALTPYGKLSALLFRPPRLGIAVRFSDGATRYYNLVRDIARSGFLLSPAFDGNVDYLRWLQGNDRAYVESVKLVQQEVFNHHAFRIAGPMRLYSMRLPRAYRPTPALYAGLYPGFNEIPVAVSEATSIPTRIETVDGESVLLLPAPAAMQFRLPPGAYEVSAQYGVMPSALTNAACLAAHADGVGIAVDVGQGAYGSPTATIDPFGDPRHRYAATFSQPVTVGPGGDAVVSLTTGAPGSNGACDWSWIRGLRFTPVPSPGRR